MKKLKAYKIRYLFGIHVYMTIIKAENQKKAEQLFFESCNYMADIIEIKEIRNE